MADDVRVTNMPEMGSKELVAFKLWEKLYDYNDSEEDNLKLFARCLEATNRGGFYFKKNFG